MPRTKLFSIGISAFGFVVLVGGGALLLSRAHHTIATASIGVGALLAAAGVGVALWTRISSDSQRPSHAKVTGSFRRTSGPRLQTAIAALIIGGATVGSYLYVSSQLSAQSGGQVG